MPKTLKMLLARYCKPADGEGNDLGGEVIDMQDSDSWTPGSPEDRGDLLDPDDSGAAAPAPAPAAPAPAPAPDGAGAPAPAAPLSPAPGAAEEEGEHETDAADGKQQSLVPHGRFHEVNERRKQVERERDELRIENERLRAGSAGKESGSTNAPTPPAPAAPAAPEFDFDAKEKTYLDALMEGDTSAAATIRREINAATMAQARRETAELMRAEFTQREQQQAQASAHRALQAEAQAVVDKYPYLDTEEGGDAMDMIIARRDALVAKGQAPHEALRAAADFIAPRFAPAGAAITPAKDLPKAPAQTDLRESAARTRGAQASIAQAPAPAAGMGNRAVSGDALDVNRMDDDQFSRLSDAEKSRLRGD